MGDRANIVMVQHPWGGKPQSLIYFYSHWGGSGLPKVLQSALIRGKGRWDDEPYLARIIFSEMIRDSVEDDTGFGISTYQADNEHPLLVVNSETKTVSVADAKTPEDTHSSVSFSRYVELTDDELEHFRVES